MRLYWDGWSLAESSLTMEMPAAPPPTTTTLSRVLGEDIEA